VALVDLRQRTGYLFITVMLAHVLLISAQVNSRSGVPVLESVTFGVFSEIQRTLSGGLSGISGMWNGYVGLRHAKVENDELKRQLAAAQIAIQEQRALADRTRGLERLLEMREKLPLKTTAADVIGESAVPDFRTVTIDKGMHDGLRTDMAVIAPAGVVGRIVIPSPRSAKVQLLIDRNAAAGAIVERSRAQGIVVGSSGERLQMEYSEASDIVAGDVVVTSGIDGIYPKGFVIGLIESVERSGGGFKRIVIKPAVDFKAIEEVLVVLTPVAEKDGAAGPKE
jgi:rod shape-determining protein MreC